MGFSFDTGSMGQGSQRVLVVEDDPSSRRALTLLLKLKGFEAIYASNVSEAMSLIEQLPHFVLLDLMLPDGNGSTVLAQIRTRNLPIRVAITSGASNWRAMIGDSKPDAYFSKPIDFDGVVQWLRAAS